jgi:hypothetical protein
MIPVALLGDAIENLCIIVEIPDVAKPGSVVRERVEDVSILACPGNQLLGQSVGPFKGRDYGLAHFVFLSEMLPRWPFSDLSRKRESLRGIGAVQKDRGHGFNRYAGYFPCCSSHSSKITIARAETLRWSFRAASVSASFVAVGILNEICASRRGGWARPFFFIWLSIYCEMIEGDYI